MAWDDGTLVAYLDGELDAETASEVERSLAGEPAARARLDALQRGAAVVRAALNPVLHETVPDRVVAAVQPQSRRTSAFARMAAPVLSVGLPTALAASVLLMAVGLGSGYVAGRGAGEEVANGTQRLEALAGGARDSAVQSALERTVSGTRTEWNDPDDEIRGAIIPVRTFRNREGRFCREFQETFSKADESIARHGVACRGATGRWHEVYRLVPVEANGRAI